MNELIVADAGPLIALGLIDALELLARVHRRTIVPRLVQDECLRHPEKPGARAIAQAFQRGWLTPQPAAPALPGRQIETLDAGESAAIELAQALSALLLIDERRGRAVALARGLRVVGTLGVLVQAKRRGMLPAVGPVIEQLHAKGYFYSALLVAQVLSRVGEDCDP